jgi:histidine ammonia-lyase
MGEVLSIIAIALLLALVAISVRKQRAGMTQTKADEATRTEGADVQRDRSMRRRDEARAAARPER